MDNSKLDNEKIYETALSETSGGIRFLDKHPINCGAGKVLSQFRMIGDNGPNVWNTGTSGKGTGPFCLRIQSDGNLGLYDSTGKATWYANSYKQGKGPYRLNLQDSGELVLLDSNNQKTWGSKSGPLSVPYIELNLPEVCADPIMASPSSYYRSYMQLDGNFVIYPQSPNDQVMKFQYKCKNVSEPLECRDVFTDWAGPCTTLDCLDRQELKCNSDESISGFQLQGKFNDFNRYKYTCCKVISSYKFKVVSNNRVSELPYEIQNEKGETLNFFIVPSTLAVRITLGDSQTTNKITSATLTMDGRILLYDPTGDLFYSVYDDEGSLWATSNSKAVANTGVWKFQDQPGTSTGLSLRNKDIFPKYPMTPADYVEIFKDKSKTQVFNCAPGDVGGSDGNCGSCPRSQHNKGSVSWSPIFQQDAYDRTCPAQTKKIYGLF